MSTFTTAIVTVTVAFLLVNFVKVNVDGKTYPRSGFNHQLLFKIQNKCKYFNIIKNTNACVFKMYSNALCKIYISNCAHILALFCLSCQVFVLYSCIEESFHLTFRM